MAKTATLYARIDPSVKEQAEEILSSLGIPASSAINIFYKQIILQKGLPFSVKLPEHKLSSLDEMTAEEFNQALEQGYQEMQDGKSLPTKKTFANIRKTITDERKH